MVCSLQPPARKWSGSDSYSVEPTQEYAPSFLGLLATADYCDYYWHCTVSTVCMPMKSYVVQIYTYDQQTHVNDVAEHHVVAATDEKPSPSLYLSPSMTQSPQLPAPNIRCILIRQRYLQQSRTIRNFLVHVRDCLLQLTCRTIKTTIVISTMKPLTPIKVLTRLLGDPYPMFGIYYHSIVNRHSTFSHFIHQWHRI